MPWQSRAIDQSMDGSDRPVSSNDVRKIGGVVERRDNDLSREYNALYTTIRVASLCGIEQRGQRKQHLSYLIVR